MMSVELEIQKHMHNVQLVKLSEKKKSKQEVFQEMKCLPYVSLSTAFFFQNMFCLNKRI
jgi:hypothetical protein